MEIALHYLQYNYILKHHALMNKCRITRSYIKLGKYYNGSNNYKPAVNTILLYLEIQVVQHHMEEQPPPQQSAKQKYHPAHKFIS